MEKFFPQRVVGTGQDSHGIPKVSTSPGAFGQGGLDLLQEKPDLFQKDFALAEEIPGKSPPPPAFQSSGGAAEFSLLFLNFF